MEWTIELMLKGTLVLLAAYALGNERVRGSASVRDTVWTITFGILLFLPFLSLVAPEWRGPVKVSYLIEAAAGGIAPAATGFDWLGWGWLVGFLIAAARLAVSHAQAAHLAAKARSAATYSGVSVRRSAAGTMPMTWGFRRPVVLLPEDADEWDPEMRESVLRHELAHVRRGDLWRQLLTQAACCLWWFHPLAWTAARRASRAREQACDDAVLNQGADAGRYAEHLIAVARGRSALAAVAGLPFGSQLENRILAVLDRHVARGPIPARAAVTAAGLAFLLLLPLSGLRLWAEQVYRVGDGVTAPKLIEKVEPRYTEEARDAGIEGTVVFSLAITKDGVADNIRIERGLNPGLDASAAAAIRQWRFEPGEKDGAPVRVAATIEINFRLDRDPPEKRN